MQNVTADRQFFSLVDYNPSFFNLTSAACCDTPKNFIILIGIAIRAYELATRLTIAAGISIAEAKVFACHSGSRKGTMDCRLCSRSFPV